LYAVPFLVKCGWKPFRVILCSVGLVDCRLLQLGWVTPNTSKLISVVRFAIYPNKIAQKRLVFGSYSVQILVVLFS
jgi:hypothetical protein